LVTGYSNMIRKDQDRSMEWFDVSSQRRHRTLGSSNGQVTAQTFML